MFGVVGQAIAIGAVFALQWRLPYLPCALLVGASAFFTLLMMISPASRRFAKPWEAAGQLIFDVCQISGQLFFTGGLNNPFCVLMVVPVMVAFATLPTRWAVAVGVLAAALAIVLAFYSAPLPWPGPTPFRLPLLYRIGAIIALVLGMAVTGGFSAWTASRASRMELALHVTETVLAREQRVSALGALAAAAAHELGTPLTTISVVAKELARETPEGPLREDAWLLMDEAQRCRGILKRLTDAPEEAESIQRISLEEFLDDVVAPYEGDPVVRVEALVSGPSDAVAPDVWRKTEILHALNSIVENAVDFARAEILLSAKFDSPVHHHRSPGRRAGLRLGDHRPPGRSLRDHQARRRRFAHRSRRHGGSAFSSPRPCLSAPGRRRHIPQRPPARGHRFGALAARGDRGGRLSVRNRTVLVLCLWAPRIATFCSRGRVFAPLSVGGGGHERYPSRG